jgi:hypothetical protein
MSVRARLMVRLGRGGERLLPRPHVLPRTLPLQEKSFGIVVAQRAGLPPTVIARATAILQQLDQVSGVCGAAAQPC